jgi:hypothetical protein
MGPGWRPHWHQRLGVRSWLPGRRRDFPPGTRLTVTARLELPCDRCDGMAVDPEDSSPGTVPGDFPEPPALEPRRACQFGTPPELGEEWRHGRRPGRRWAVLDACPPERSGAGLALGVRRRGHGQPRAAIRLRRELLGGDTRTLAYPPGPQRPKVVSMTAPLGPEKASGDLRALPAPGTVTTDGMGHHICAATVLHPLHGIKQCDEPAGHYDEGQAPERGADAGDPGGWHRSAPGRDGRRFIWSDRFDAATSQSGWLARGCPASRPFWNDLAPCCGVPALPWRPCRSPAATRVGGRPGPSGRRPLVERERCPLRRRFSHRMSGSGPHKFADPRCSPARNGSLRPPQRKAPSASPAHIARSTHR